jgi:hypothetical protein
LDRLPATLAADDERLPGVVVGASPLRLNSVPLPIEVWGDGTSDHAGRVAALRAWLLGACGDYNGALRRAVSGYIDAIGQHIERHRAELAAALAAFHGLYQPEDWIWSALRPLPRAWWREGEAWRHADLAFWDGGAVIAMRAEESSRNDLPAPFQYFWNNQTLPVSPFRKLFPSGPAVREE